LDGSELGERIIPHALALARAFDAPVTLLRVLECPPAGTAISDPMEWEIRRSEARERLDDIVHARRATYASIDTDLVEGHAAEQICLWARHNDADMTVLSSHGASGPTQWSLASTARKLVDRVPGSFMLVPAAAPAIADEMARYRKILVPMDGSLRASVLPSPSASPAPGRQVILGHVVPIPELTEIGPLDSEALELRESSSSATSGVASTYRSPASRTRGERRHHPCHGPARRRRAFATGSTHRRRGRRPRRAVRARTERARGRAVRQQRGVSPRTRQHAATDRP
jgi:nucleotide-binding universal stress UspA family protein